MYSKAKLAGHPIHPMLIGFPVAFYTGTVVTLIVFGATGDPFWYRAALTLNIAGLVMAVAAIVPGAVDLFTGIPAGTPARRTGVRHAAFNVASNLMFFISAMLLWRSWEGRSNLGGRVVLESAPPLLFSVVGLVAMIIAGTLGWKLVQKHHVGVDPVSPDEQDAYPVHDTLPGMGVPTVSPPDDRGVGPTGLH